MNPHYHIVDWAADHPGLRAGLDLLAAWIDSQMAYGGLPGLSAGIVCDQELIWARGFGLAHLQDARPATPSAIYRIASISKTFTSTAIMQLRDAGKLRLDDPVVAHLPWFAMGGNSAEAPAITLRHLITHTSGLPREAAFPYWLDFQFPSREQLIASLPGQETTYPPETRFKYSNLAVAIAGEVVSAVSGQTYEEYVHSRILDPLGMVSTSVSLPDSQRRRLAAGYTRRLPGVEREITPFTDSDAIAPAANLSSTVEDLAGFISLQFGDGPAGGRQILKGSSLREMHRPHWVFPDWSGARGLGFEVYRHPGRTLVGHGGHVAGYRTQIVFSPDERIGAVVLTNASDGDPMSFTNWIFQHVAPVIAAATKSQPKVGIFQPQWDSYLGRYRNRWSDSQVLRQGEELVLIDPTAENPDGSKYRLVPLDESRFRLEGTDGSGPVGELAVFELGPDGQVERLKIGEGVTFPIQSWVQETES